MTRQTAIACPVNLTGVLVGFAFNPARHFDMNAPAQIFLYRQVLTSINLGQSRRSRAENLAA
jgi:hypothetical protein